MLDKNAEFFTLKYCHFSRFGVICSIKHIFSIRQKDYVVTILILSGKLCEN